MPDPGGCGDVIVRPKVQVVILSGLVALAVASTIRMHRFTVMSGPTYRPISADGLAHARLEEGTVVISDAIRCGDLATRLDPAGELDLCP